MPLSNLTLDRRGTGGRAERHIFAMPTSEPSPNRPKYPVRPIILSAHSSPTACHRGTATQANSTVQPRYRPDLVLSYPKGPGMIASGKGPEEISLSTTDLNINADKIIPPAQPETHPKTLL
jgi:hypothetical protein